MRLCNYRETCTYICQLQRKKKERKKKHCRHFLLGKFERDCTPLRQMAATNCFSSSFRRETRNFFPLSILIQLLGTLSELVYWHLVRLCAGGRRDREKETRQYRVRATCTTCNKHIVCKSKITLLYANSEANSATQQTITEPYDDRRYNLHLRLLFDVP